MNIKVSLGALILLLSLAAGCSSGSGGSNPPLPEPDPPQPLPPPVCTLTFSWTNPTHDVDDWPLDVDELKAATLYQFRIPMAGPEDAEAIIDAGDPYTVMYTVNDVQVGGWWWTMTVSNRDALGNLQESGHSEEILKACE